MKKKFIELFWCIEGKGTYIIDSKNFVLSPGEVCFYTQGDIHDIHAVTESFQYRWMVFDGAESTRVWEGLHLQKQPYFAGICPEELFIQLTREITNYTENGLKKASATAFRILMLSSCRQSSYTDKYNMEESARGIFDSEFRNPRTTVASVAAELHTDRSQLSRKFRACYGVNPVQYLINLRIQHGISLLVKSEMQIKEIANRSGFNDPNYFTKAMKKYAGVKVSQMRK